MANIPKIKPLSQWLGSRQPASDDRSNMRAVLNSLIMHLHPPTVPATSLRFTYTWGLGGISALLVMMLGLTGVLLMFRYDASVERAYSSIQFLEAEVMFGALVRSVHHWSANLLVLTVFLHCLRVFLTGGFKGIRAGNWRMGLLLLILVLAFNFTGYLLPWDQLAYWAITVSTSLIAYLPLIGETISRFVLAGPEVGQAALRNFYAFHVAVLPVILVGSLAYHFWRVRKSGGLSQPRPEGEARVETRTTIPHLVNREAAVASFVAGAVVLFAMFNRAPLGELANPVRSPNPAKAAWYFQGLQELLLHMDALAAIVLVAGVVFGLFMLPAFDREEEDIGVYFRSRKGRWAALLGAVIALDLIPLLVAADEYWINLQGWLPGWPAWASNGVLPLGLTLAGLGLVYAFMRVVLKARRGESLIGLVVFLFAGLVVLTVIGVLFRGPNMALIWPF